MLHSDLNLNLFEPVASLIGAAQRLKGITVANRPFRSLRGF